MNKTEEWSQFCETISLKRAKPLSQGLDMTFAYAAVYVEPIYVVVLALVLELGARFVHQFTVGRLLNSTCC